MIAPEQLKRLAEYMGKKNVRIVKFLHNGKLYCAYDRKILMFNDAIADQYNPPENAEQAGELEIKFKMATEWNEATEQWEADILDDDLMMLFEGAGDTPSEARTLAAINYMESENGL